LITRQVRRYETDSRSEPTPTDPRDVSGRRRPLERRRRASSVDSLVNWQTAASSLSDSDRDERRRPRRTTRRLPPPPPPSDRAAAGKPASPSTATKFRGDLGLVPTNIASLSVEEVIVIKITIATGDIGF